MTQGADRLISITDLFVSHANDDDGDVPDTRIAYGSVDDRARLALPNPARRARLSVVVLFVLMGTTTGSWAARIPSVRQQLDVTDAQWGLANVGATVGSLISLTVVMAVIVRVGPRRLSLIGGPLLLLNAPFLAGSTSLPALISGLFVQGAATGLLAGPMNAQAVEVERQYKRRIMSSFHATFSCGQLVGGVIGIFAAHAGVRPNVQLACTGVVLGVLLLSTHQTTSARAASRRRRRECRCGNGSRRSCSCWRQSPSWRRSTKGPLRSGARSTPPAP